MKFLRAFCSLECMNEEIIKIGKEQAESVAGHDWGIQFSSVAQSCSTLCDPMSHSTPGLPVHHQLLEFTQTCVH